VKSLLVTYVVRQFTYPKAVTHRSTNGLDVEQLRWSRPTRYRYTKPPPLELRQNLDNCDNLKITTLLSYEIIQKTNLLPKDGIIVKARDPSGGRVVETAAWWSPPDADRLGLTGWVCNNVYRIQYGFLQMSSCRAVLYFYSKFRIRNWICRYRNYFQFRWWKSDTSAFPSGGAVDWASRAAETEFRSCC